MVNSVGKSRRKPGTEFTVLDDNTNKLLGKVVFLEPYLLRYTETPFISINCFERCLGAVLFLRPMHSRMMGAEIINQCLSTKLWHNPTTTHRRHVHSQKRIARAATMSIPTSYNTRWPFFNGRSMISFSDLGQTLPGGHATQGTPWYLLDAVDAAGFSLPP